MLITNKRPTSLLPFAVCLLPLSSALLALGLPPGHARRAALPPVSGERFLRGRQFGAAARRGHCRARIPARRRHAALSGQGERPAGDGLPVPDHASGSRSRAGALQHLLRAVPRPHRRRQRHGRAARLPSGRQLPHRSAARTRRSAISTTSCRTASARCRTTRRRSPSTIAGASSPTSARCSSAHATSASDVPADELKKLTGGGR